MNGEIVSYRPSAFYYRATLRESRSRTEAIALTLSVVNELESLHAWARARGVRVAGNPSEDAAVGLHQARTRAAVVVVGRAVILRLEELKAAIRADGLIPPRWFALPEEHRGPVVGEHRGQESECEVGSAQLRVVDVHRIPSFSSIRRTSQPGGRQ